MRFPAEWGPVILLAWLLLLHLAVQRLLQAMMLVSVVFGAVREADVVWQLGDIGVGLMAWFTVIAIIILCPKAIQALKEFEKR